MSFKDIRKQQFQQHRRVNTTSPSKWPKRISASVLMVLLLVAGGYDFPGAWNQTIGRIPGLTMYARDYRLGLDLLGGAHLVYEADLSQVVANERTRALEGVRDVIERRVNAFGVAEPVVQTVKTLGDRYRLIVELAGVQDVGAAIREIGETPILEFKRPARVADVPVDDGDKTVDQINKERRELAESLLGRARKQGEDFDALVAQESQGPQRAAKGVSAWVDASDPRARVLPARGHDLGAIYINVLEKNESYSIVKYDSHRDAKEWLFSAIVVCYQGAQDCDDGARDKAEAKRRAQQIRDEAMAKTFASLVATYTDDEAQRGGGDGDQGWNRQRNVDVNLAVGLATHVVGDIFAVDTARGYLVAHKRGERPYDEYRFQEIEILKAGVEPAAINPWEDTALGGAHLKRTAVEFDPNTGIPYVSLQFNQEGADLFAQLTEELVGQQIAIFLDGAVISAPVVEAAIVGGEAIITGLDDVAEARLLSQRLNAGALPVPVELVSQQTVGPTLGVESLNRSLVAAMVGIALVALFMLLYYRLPGLVSIVALGAYAIIVLAIFKALPVTLTLAGLAGLVLSIGMAVDANVLIFERLKEELRHGRVLNRAIDEAVKRAWLAIRDGNFTTLIACAILYWLSSSFIQGFALTLAVGVLMSMFSAVVMTRWLLHAAAYVKPLRRAFLYCVKTLNV